VKAAIYVLGGLAVVVFLIVRQRRSDRFRVAARRASARQVYRLGGGR
jgi:hypothetical protein